MAKQLDVLIVVGSLRKGSYNRMLAAAAAESVPDELVVEVADLRGIPPFDADLRDSAGVPEAVAALKEGMQGARSILFVSPEYNYSIPGVMKNAIDWVSDGSEHPFGAKPVAITGTSTGRFGTVRMQMHLRDVLCGLGALVLPKPEVMIADARTKFDADGRLVDERSAEQIRGLVAALIRWADRHTARP